MTVFDVGLKHSSPSTILEHMPEHEQITSERIKSHLQKYRLHRAKSKKEFMSCYDATIEARKKKQEVGCSLGGGEVAGHIAYSTMTNESTSSPPDDNGTKGCKLTETDADDAKKQEQEADTALVFPRLSEEEKLSPIGMSMGYLMGLFFTLKQQLKDQRSQKVQSTSIPDTHISHCKDNTEPKDSAKASLLVPRSTGSLGTRGNLEENSMMKREMEYQMVFQNKMRALKQQELDKYKGQNEQEGGVSAATEAGGGKELMSNLPASQPEAADDGEAPRSRQREVSIGAAEDLWNTDIVDDQLFEFLMNN